MVSTDVAALLCFKAKQAPELFWGHAGSFECDLRNQVHRMPKNGDSQPKGGLSPRCLVSWNGKIPLCKWRLKDLTEFAETCPVCLRQGCESIWQRNRTISLGVQLDREGRCGSDGLARKGARAPSQAPTATRRDVLGKTAFALLFRSQSVGIMCYFSCVCVCV